ncbi:MAG: hypothetical protein NTV55_10600 [Planctomycetota bacterium]|nr:hypothetical protein [Planctomycetota bacterium]
MKKRRFGWIDDPMAVRVVAAGLETPLFGATAAGTDPAPLPDSALLWQACRQVLGDLLPPRDQGSVGSCVGFGTVAAIEHTLCAEIAGGDPDGFHDIAPEIVYGGSRVEVGGGQLRGDGSIGAWAAEFVRRWGVLERGRHGTLDISTYSPSICRQLGVTGVPDDLEATCRLHPVEGVARVDGFAAACRALAAGYGIAVCSSQGFAMRRDSEGFCAPRGVWNHCMALVGYRRTGRAGGFLLNSWGGQAHTGPLGEGDPSPAGFWAEATVIDRMLRQGDSWAFSRVRGFPRRQLEWQR